MDSSQRHSLEASLIAQCRTFLANERQGDAFFLPTRKRAYDAFIEGGVPSRKLERYRYTPLVETLTPLFAAMHPVADVPPVVDTVLPSSLQEVEGYVITLYNGKLVLPDQSKAKWPFTLLGWEEASNQYRDLLHTHFSKQASASKDAFVNLNTVLFQGGFFLYVPPHTHIEKPIIIHHYTDSTQPMMVHPRLMLVIGAHSTATCIETFSTGASSAPTLSNRVSEIVLAPQSKLDTYVWQLTQTIPYQLRYAYIRQETESRFKQHFISSANKSPLVRDETTVKQEGAYAEAHLHGLYVNQEAQHLAMHTQVHHCAPHTTTSQHYRGIGKGSSTTLFDGYIDIAPEGQGAEAQQQHRGWILSEKAAIHARPQLAIKADDVKCSHGVTTTQPDPSALFYLQTRGIPYPKAEEMLLKGFFEKEMDRLGDDQLREIARQAIFSHLHV